MAGYQEHYQELRKLGAGVFAASVDDVEKTRELADGKDFAFGCNVPRSVAAALDSWWEERRQIIQPSEFILNAAGKVMTSCYASGPVGRIPAEDAIRIITFYEKQKAQQS